MRVRMLVFVLILLTGALPSVAQNDQILASLEPIQGIVQMQTADSDLDGPWQTVTETVLVGEGDRIRTDSEGLAYLTFFDGIESQILPDTWVVVSTLNLPADDSGDINVTFDQLVGSTFTNIEVSLDASDRFEIHTPTVTAVVRGTRWTTTVLPTGETVVDVEDGVVELIPYDSGESVNAEMGSAVEVDTDGAVTNLDDYEPPQPPTGGVLPAPNCGDGICAADETCSVDCAPVPDTCGNEICDRDQGEQLLSCSQDCGPQGGFFLNSRDPQLCGNGTCDATESALNCPADCQTTCAVTADASVNIRYGPGTNFGVMGNIQQGNPISVLGTNADLTWYALSYNGTTGWVSGSVVTTHGNCTQLQAVPEPAPPTEPPSEGTGQWESCGSCNTCGYPEKECVQSPTGECLWDPATCVNVGGNTTGLPRLSVSQSSSTCFDGESATASVTYVQKGSETMTSCSAGPSTGALSVAASQTGPTQCIIYLDCGNPGMPASGTQFTISVTVTNSDGQSLNITFGQTVRPVM